ncbi:ArsR/SmtB family transcription factor [Fructilactobacillus frigidiflavus]|uniref:ArsR/SmtB family transcription factor n=1 Tax=Fructilactobacillus frigidiflavus TaxID=3242688 RepID=UPI003756A10F
MERNNYISYLKAMANDHRLEIIDYLSSDETMCVCDLLKYFEISQPTLSHHLKVLIEANIVECSKNGQFNMYKLNPIFTTNFYKDTDKLLSNKKSKNQNESCIS